jgi:hypothetical protein
MPIVMDTKPIVFLIIILLVVMCGLGYMINDKRTLGLTAAQQTQTYSGPNLMQTGVFYEATRQAVQYQLTNEAGKYEETQMAKQAKKAEARATQIAAENSIEATQIAMDNQKAESAAKIYNERILTITAAIVVVVLLFMSIAFIILVFIAISLEKRKEETLPVEPEPVKTQPQRIPSTRHPVQSIPAKMQIKKESNDRNKYPLAG